MLKPDTFDWWKAWFGMLPDNQQDDLLTMLSKTWGFCSSEDGPAEFRHIPVEELPKHDSFNCREWNEFLELLYGAGGPAVSRNPEVLAFWVRMSERAETASLHAHAADSIVWEIEEEKKKRTEEEYVDELHRIEADDLQRDREEWADDYRRQQSEFDGEKVDEDSIAGEMEADQDVLDSGIEDDQRPGEASEADADESVLHILEEGESAPSLNDPGRFVPCLAPWEVEWSRYGDISLWCAEGRDPSEDHGLGDELWSAPECDPDDVPF